MYLPSLQKWIKQGLVKDKEASTSSSNPPLTVEVLSESSTLVPADQQTSDRMPTPPSISGTDVVKTGEESNASIRLSEIPVDGETADISAPDIKRPSSLPPKDTDTETPYVEPFVCEHGELNPKAWNLVKLIDAVCAA